MGWPFLPNHWRSYRNLETQNHYWITWWIEKKQRNAGKASVLRSAPTQIWRHVDMRYGMFFACPDTSHLRYTRLGSQLSQFSSFFSCVFGVVDRPLGPCSHMSSCMSYVCVFGFSIDMHENPIIQKKCLAKWHQHNAHAPALSWIRVLVLGVISLTPLHPGWQWPGPGRTPLRCYLSKRDRWTVARDWLDWTVPVANALVPGLFSLFFLNPFPPLRHPLSSPPYFVFPSSKPSPSLPSFLQLPLELQAIHSRA